MTFITITAGGIRIYGYLSEVFDTEVAGVWLDESGIQEVCAIRQTEYYIVGQDSRSAFHGIGAECHGSLGPSCVTVELEGQKIGYFPNWPVRLLLAKASRRKRFDTYRKLAVAVHIDSSQAVMAAVSEPLRIAGDDRIGSVPGLLGGVTGPGADLGAVDADTLRRSGIFVRDNPALTVALTGQRVRIVGGTLLICKPGQDASEVRNLDGSYHGLPRQRNAATTYADPGLRAIVDPGEVAVSFREPGGSERTAPGPQRTGLFYHDGSMALN